MFFSFFISGVRQEQDIYVRLIDSVTKQVRPDYSKNDFLLFSSVNFFEVIVHA